MEKIHRELAWTTKPLGGWGVKSLVVQTLKKTLFLCVSSLIEAYSSYFMFNVQVVYGLFFYKDIFLNKKRLIELRVQGLSFKLPPDLK